MFKLLFFIATKIYNILNHNYSRTINWTLVFAMVFPTPVFVLFFVILNIPPRSNKIGSCICDSTSHCYHCTLGHKPPYLFHIFKTFIRENVRKKLQINHRKKDDFLVPKKENMPLIGESWTSSVQNTNHY